METELEDDLALFAYDDLNDIFGFRFDDSSSCDQLELADIIGLESFLLDDDLDWPIVQSNNVVGINAVDDDGIDNDTNDNNDNNDTDGIDGIEARRLVIESQNSAKKRKSLNQASSAIKSRKTDNISLSTAPTTATTATATKTPTRVAEALSSSSNQELLAKYKDLLFAFQSLVSAKNSENPGHVAYIVNKYVEPNCRVTTALTHSSHPGDIALLFDAISSSIPDFVVMMRSIKILPNGDIKGRIIYSGTKLYDHPEDIRFDLLTSDACDQQLKDQANAILAAGKRYKIYGKANVRLTPNATKTKFQAIEMLQKYVALEGVSPIEDHSTLIDASDNGNSGEDRQAIPLEASTSS